MWSFREGGGRGHQSLDQTLIVSQHISTADPSKDALFCCHQNTTDSLDE